jgi:hypothetical protein
MIAQLSIIFIILITFGIILYYSLSGKTYSYEVISKKENVDENIEENVEENVEPEYFNPICIYNDYLPDSLYPKNYSDFIEFEGLNLDPYIGRIMEVNDLIYRENINDLRTF